MKLRNVIEQLRDGQTYTFKRGNIFGAIFCSRNKKGYKLSAELFGRGNIKESYVSHISILSITELNHFIKVVYKLIEGIEPLKKAA